MQQSASIYIIIIIIIIIYLSAHVQRTKQALGIAPHEALFKKKKQTHKKFTETLQRIVDHHTNLFFHIFLITIPTPLSLHAPSKIIANFSSSSAASNSPPLWVPLTLSYIYICMYVCYNIINGEKSTEKLLSRAEGVHNVPNGLLVILLYSCLGLVSGQNKFNSGCLEL